MLSMFVNDRRDNWHELLPFIMHTYRTSVHESTGYSPFRLMMGEECSLPQDVSTNRNGKPISPGFVSVPGDHHTMKRDKTEIVVPGQPWGLTAVKGHSVNFSCAIMYRCHPLTNYYDDAIASGALVACSSLPPMVETHRRQSMHVM